MICCKKGNLCDEATKFLEFHFEQQTDVDTKRNIIELVILFQEDFKFMKRMHHLFDNDICYLSAVGFIAGGNKPQIPHHDVTDLDVRSHEPSTPHSLVLPIAKDGRDLYVHGVEKQHKFHIPYGTALCFDGNVLHAGAKSKGSHLDHLALHIHIDHRNNIRVPNILDTYHKKNEKPWDSDDDKE